MGNKGRDEKTIVQHRLILAYRRYQTCRATGKALGLSHTTVAKMLRDIGFPVLDRKKASDIARRSVKHYGSFAVFLKGNKGKPLPRNVLQLVELSGCSKNAIACYLYRRRKEVKVALKEMPDLRKIKVKLQDDLGGLFSSQDIIEYEYAVDRFSLKTSIICVMKGGKKVVFPINDIASFMASISNIGK